MGKEILTMKHISKSFPGVKALDDVEFHIYEGEVMGFLGENGAGKSTLMKILSGVYIKDAGTITLDGEPYEVNRPSEAMEKGVAIIHQELNLVPAMNVYENIFLGREPVQGGGRLKKAEMRTRARELLAMLQVNIDPDCPVSSLSIAQQQMVEVAKALSLNAHIIIMDEPTGTLTTQEVHSLFQVIRRLTAANKGIVYISHRLEEIDQICDRYIVLRDGKFIGERRVAESQQDEMIRMMVGRTMEEQMSYVPAHPEGVLLDVRHLTTDDVTDISFTVRAGEIVGLAGLVGAGRTELAHALYGAAPIRQGEILLNGQDARARSPREAIDHGIVYVSEDRKSDGLILNMTVQENMTLPSLKKFTKNGRIDKAAERKATEGYVAGLAVKTPSIHQVVDYLSGGNQQKVAIAKALMTEPEVLVLDEPTRGIDVGAKHEIYELLNEIKARGKAVLMISSDMPEILGICDRILVMNEGRLKGELMRDEATQERIMEKIVEDVEA